MKSRDELAREVEVLSARIATPSAAVLRLGSSLDLATVLQEVAESARTLTNARYSLIVTADETGARRASSSPRASPPTSTASSPSGPTAQRSSPISVTGRARSGLPTCPTGSARTATPTSWRARRPRRARRCATPACRSTTSSWPARRTHSSSAPPTRRCWSCSPCRRRRGRQRALTSRSSARVDLEAMIETTLVGVAAVNARTGQPVSFNREADLIVEPPRMPGGNIA